MFLCEPAQLYVVMTISFIIAVVINYNTEYFDFLHVRKSSNTNENSHLNVIIWVSIHILYMMLIVYFLNGMCFAGVPYLAWFLVLAPILVFFILTYIYINLLPAIHTHLFKMI